MSPAADRRAASATLALQGHPVTDLSAAAGAVVWIGLTLGLGLDAVERAVALAPLVLVPLGLGMAATPPFRGLAGSLSTVAVAAQPAAALLAALSLTLDGTVAAALAVPWLLFAVLLAATGAARVADRGVTPLSETVVDVGLAYVVVAAAALVAYHLDVTLWYSPVIVLLTAVHFHYAGFVLPVFTGLAGRCVGTAEDPLFRSLAAVVAVGPGLIGLGIAFSALVEIVAVAVFTAAVTVLGVYVALRVLPDRPRRQAAVVATAALTLPLSMALALGFLLATYAGIDPLSLSVGRMVSLHGSLNAFGFATLGLLGWRLAVPSRDE